MVDEPPKAHDFGDIVAADARPGGMHAVLDWLKTMPSLREGLLVCTAEAEDALRLLILSALDPRTPPQVWEDLGLDERGGDKALSTFSARINVAVALGVITPGFGEVLHGAKILRNKCAHSRVDYFETEAEVAMRKAKPKFEKNTPWAELREFVEEFFNTTEHLDFHTIVFITAWLSQTMYLNGIARTYNGFPKGRPGYALAPSFLVNSKKSIERWRAEVTAEAAAAEAAQAPAEPTPEDNPDDGGETSK